MIAKDIQFGLLANGTCRPQDVHGAGVPLSYFLWPSAGHEPVEAILRAAEKNVPTSTYLS